MYDNLRAAQIIIHTIIYIYIYIVEYFNEKTCKLFVFDENAPKSRKCNEFAQILPHFK